MHAEILRGRIHEDTGKPKRGEEETVMAIRQQIRILQSEGRNHGLEPDRVLLMINKGYGFLWDNIPFFRFEELCMYVKNNGDKWLGIVYPELDHAHKQELKKIGNNYTRESIMKESKIKLFGSNITKGMPEK